MEHERFILSLLSLPGIGRKSGWKVVQATKEIPKTSDQMLDLVADVDGLRVKVDRDKARAIWEQAEGTLNRAGELGISAISATRECFPVWIQSIPDAPMILFIKGNADCIRNSFAVAVIGTRQPSEYGQKVAHRFGQRGTEAGCVVVSGLAVGCDTAAHRGCLDAGGKAVAVLAHGLDSVYPKESRELANEILEKDGCWVSEYPPGTRAQRSFFVERDRLQSGLSGGIIVVETDTVGGTMHTVRFAETQGRLVACLKHPDTEAQSNDKARGNRQLLEEKRAIPLASSQDFSQFMECLKHQANEAAQAGCTVEETTKGKTQERLF